MADDQNISAQIRGKIRIMLRRVKFSRAGWWSTVPVCRRELNPMVHLHALIFSLKAAAACRSSARMGKADKKCSFTQRLVERFVHVYGWFSRGYGQYRSSISMLSRPMANTPGTGNTVLKNSGALDMDVTTGTDSRFSPCQRQFTDAIRCISTTMADAAKTELTTAQLTLITDEGLVNENRKHLLYRCVMLAS